MTYYHVIVKTKPDGKYLKLFTDFSAKDLRNSFVKPFEHGESFFSGNDLISPHDLQSVLIIKTTRPDKIEREEFNRKDLQNISNSNNLGDGLFIVSVGRGYNPEDIAEVGDDVTRDFLKGSLGFKSKRWWHFKKLLGWIFGIIATVLAGLAIKWTSEYFW